MKIYTKTGDAGETLVYVNDAKRVNKSDLIIHVYGELDEVNAQMGMLASMLHQNADAESVQRIQSLLFEAGYTLSASSRLSADDLTWLEQDIDRMTETLAAQTSFILPAGCQAASQAHICRTVCRRAERAMVALSQQDEVSDIAMAFVNRLSDWLYTFARYLNAQAGIEDVPVRQRVPEE